MLSNFIEAVKKSLKEPKYVTILSHRNPDGDAVGSSLALMLMLKKFGHTARVVLPSEYPAAYTWMPGLSEIVIYDLDTDLAQAYIEASEVIFALDFNSLDRIDKVGMDVLAKKDPCDIFLIDHHIDPEPFADEMFSKTEASSTCEMVMTFFEAMNWSDKIDNNIATALYTGIVTDTGSFKYNTNANVFRQVSELKENGLQDHIIQDLIFNSRTTKQLQLLGYCLNKRLEVMEEEGVAIIYLTRKDYEYWEIERGDTEGIVNTMMSIKHVKLAAFITGQPKITKLSLRSKGDISVQALARDHFKGGGHFNASGGYSYKNVITVIEKLKSVLPNYINKTT